MEGELKSTHNDLSGAADKSTANRAQRLKGKGQSRKKKPFDTLPPTSGSFGVRDSGLVHRPSRRK